MSIDPKSQSQQGKRWLITINNPSDEEIDELIELPGCKFKVIARETAPSTGTSHIHALVIFTCNARIKKVKKLFPRAHLDIVRGTFDQAYNYVIKEGAVIYENGEKPKHQQDINGRFKELVQQAKAGTIDKESLMYCRYRQYFEQFVPTSNYIFEGELTTKNAWIYGPPGSGKSKLVRQFAMASNLSVYHKLANKWWDGYRGEDIVLIEDLDPDVAEKLVHHIKLWADRYAFRAEVKGNSISIDPRFYLIVTSNYSIGECFKGVDGEAISRRFEEWQLD